MRYTIAENARPQVNLLIFATFISLGLWFGSWFIPLTGYIVYPLQLFATFIHEGSHVLATLLTGNTVQSLTVSPDGSGVVWSESSGWFSQLLISSAGYIGTTAFGAALLAWIRFGYSSRTALYLSAAFIGIMTFVFGILAPFWNFMANVTFGSIVFTVFSGTILTVGIAAVARYANAQWANFALAFLAVQCLLNAIFSLLSLFVISTITTTHSDAVNMAEATSIPAIFWVLIWTGISIALISIGLRVYAVSKRTSTNDSVFEG